MSFDPNLPLENTEVDAVEMRSQLNGLKELIDAIVSISSATVDLVTTGQPGDPASVSVSVVGGTLVFNFSMPRGDTGEAGPPGEVTQGQLDTALANTSANSNGVSLIDLNPPDPPSLADFEALRAKVNELINALRR